ncbi:uncharacterized protein LOC119384801 [Rhipicephalus sanguineus]|uniref:uncharacterized protein LOC119384801 n=1 Tax=Rhipicephalus sanguineus TaxID=34632 RepID=UPI0020C2F16C|nr:uncharacterized protein LOC119384801 [Rhipicephalus sanguineus]
MDAEAAPAKRRHEDVVAASQDQHLALGQEICLQTMQPFSDISRPTTEDWLKMGLFEELLRQGLEEAALDVATLMAGNQELLQKAKEICAARAPRGALAARLQQLKSNAGHSTPRHEAPTIDPTAIKEVEALLQGVWDSPAGRTLQPCSAIEWRHQLRAVLTEEPPEGREEEEAPDVPGEEAAEVRVQPLGGAIPELNHSMEHRGTDASTERLNRRKRRHRRRRYRRNKPLQSDIADQSRNPTHGMYFHVGVSVHIVLV